MPLPALVRPAAPSIMGEMVVETPVVIVGVVPANVRVVAPARAQVPAVAVSVSPKLMLPTILDASRLTVKAPAGRLSVEKSAVLPEPSAMGPAPLFQLAMSLQLPLVTVPVQVPSAASAEVAMAHSEAQATREERVRGDMAERERSGAFIEVFGMAGFA